MRVLLGDAGKGQKALTKSSWRLPVKSGALKINHGASPRIAPKGTSFGAHPGYGAADGVVARMKAEGRNPGWASKKIHHGASFPDSIQATHPDQIAD